MAVEEEKKAMEKNRGHRLAVAIGASQCHLAEEAEEVAPKKPKHAHRRCRLVPKLVGCSLPGPGAYAFGVCTVPAQERESQTPVLKETRRKKINCVVGFCFFVWSHVLSDLFFSFFLSFVTLLLSCS